MTIVDTALFQLSLNLIALRIPARKCSAFMSRLQGHVLNRPRVRPILRDDASAESRLLLLAEGVTDVELAGLPAELAAYARAEGAEPVPHTVELDYSYFTADQVLRRLLPEGMEVPGAFEQVGHIAHVNLRDEHLPFKEVIGRVLLDKNAPRIRSVVNKVETISEQGGDDAATTARRVFRVFPMEVLAGDDDLRATVRENGASFKLDYREVYWNSRLEREHRRIVEMLQPGDVVADMFAGIGPFAVPAAMRGAKVYANDLNPQSAAWLRTNVDGNKVASRVAVSNLDGRAFVRHLLGTADGAAADGAAADGAADGESASFLSRFGFGSGASMAAFARSLPLSLPLCSRGGRLVASPCLARYFCTRPRAASSSSWMAAASLRSMPSSWSICARRALSSASCAAARLEASLERVLTFLACRRCASSSLPFA